MFALSQKFGGNLANITAGDLLNKSQEELVLILIQLRRQSASLLEAIDACKAEQDNMRNLGHQPSLDLRQHTWELEEQLARVNPVINLVDNMVKLGTLYRGADVNAPLSQRLSDLQREESEEKLVVSEGDEMSKGCLMSDITRISRPRPSSGWTRWMWRSSSRFWRESWPGFRTSWR